MILHKGMKKHKASSSILLLFLYWQRDTSARVIPTVSDERAGLSAGAFVNEPADKFQR